MNDIQEPDTNSVASVLLWLLAVAGLVGALICFVKSGEVARGATLLPANQMLAGVYFAWSISCAVSAVICAALALIAADATKARIYARLAWERATSSPETPPAT